MSMNAFASCHSAFASKGCLCSKAGKGVVSGGIGTFRLASGCLGAGKGLLGSDKEVDVVKVIALGWIHRLSPPLEELFFMCQHYANEGVRSQLRNSYQ